MKTTESIAPTPDDTGVTPEHYDVLIVGAGISGIGAACHLKRKVSDKSFAILEAREAIGGTWDLFRYPGIRSDSDLHTFAYAFKPWTADNAIADGQEILDYLHETVEEYDVAPHIRFGHKVVGAAWSSEDARWTIRVERVATGETRTVTCAILFSAAGYFSYDAGFRPEFEGERGLRRDDRPPAGVAGGPRLHRQARRRHRQRRYRDHADPGDGPRRRARDHAPALARLRGQPAGEGPRRQHPAADPSRAHRLPDRARDEHRAPAGRLRPEQGPAGSRAPRDPRLQQAPAPARL